jgi:putative hydrolase of HD superfamily
MMRPLNQRPMKDLKSIINFLFETGILQHTPRSGFFFLGSGSQSVAEHINRVCYIGMVLAKMNKQADTAKVLEMCLLHDLAETRVSDLNYVHQQYNERLEEKAVNDLAETLPFGDEMKGRIEEYEARESIEAQLTKDADNLEFLLSLKEQIDIGNKRAATWIKPLLGRLLTEEGKLLAKGIIATDSDAWWYGDKDNDWWVNRNK